MIRPTLLGWKAIAFFALLWVAFFAAPYQNLYFLLLAFLCSIALLGVAWTTRNVAGAGGEVAHVAPFAAHAPATFRARVDAKRRRRLNVAVVLDLGRRRKAVARVAIVEGALEVVGEIPSLPRGIHEVRRAWIESSWPLGLVAVRRRIAAPRELVVHPVPASLPNAPGGGLAALTGAMGGAAGAAQPSGIRDFRAGDELRSVHWRATARRGRPVVTEWDAVAGEGLEVVFDRRCDEFEFDEALSLLAAVAIASRDAKEAVTLHTQGISRTFGAGAAATWNDLLRVLAAADRLPADGPAPPAASPSVLHLPSRREKVPA